MTGPFKIRLSIKTPQGTLELTPERAGLPLPEWMGQHSPGITYGPYLDALSRFLTQHSCKALFEALSQHTARSGKDFSPDAVQSVKVVSQKHGALYNVAEVQVDLGDIGCSFALNSALGSLQQSFLVREFHLLEDLWKRFGLPYFPRPYFLGEVPLNTELTGRHTLKLFLAEWFRGYHEFHLSAQGDDPYPVIKVWDTDLGESILRPDETRSLYHKASSILTSYFDEQSFKQIYPWHHAAGDFILKHRNREVDVRMVTARDYRSLLPNGFHSEDRWIAIAHFFLNLTLRMRLDRLDGTGPLVWAPPSSLSGVISGFFDSWGEKARKAKEAALPPPNEVLQLLRSFSLQELMPLVEQVLEDGLVESDEDGFFREHIQEHVDSLYRALHGEESLDWL